MNKAARVTGLVAGGAGTRVVGNMVVGVVARGSMLRGRGGAAEVAGPADWFVVSWRDGRAVSCCVFLALGRNRAEQGWLEVGATA